MNKKLFLSMFAAAGMLFATSCSNDELETVHSGDKAQVTFSLAAEGGIATRAISDGTNANLLYYAIFDADGHLITGIEGSTKGLFKKEQAFPNGNKKDNVEVTLAKGQKYTAVFWAQNASCNAYKVTAETDGLKVAVDYKDDKNDNNNDETRDAFFKADTFTVTGNTEISVFLKRPFAQINVGVTQADWDAAVASGVKITESKVVIKNAATSINLLDGTVSGEEEVTYDFATIPAPVETLEVDVNRDGTIQEDEKYVYLSMSYILTSAERTTLESDGLQFTFSPASGEDIVFNEGLHTVPVQRNWRTNILGKLLTGDIQFNIEIDQEFDDNYNFMYPDKDDNSMISVTTADEITNAIKNATSDITINFANDITGNVIAEQKEGVNVVINGNGYTYDGTITIDGNARFDKAETLTFTNINFEHANGDIDFISCNVGGGNDGYAHNVTVKDCTFKGNENGNVVGMRYRQCYNMSVVNCTATDVHSLMWATGCDRIVVDGVNVTVNKEGGLTTNTSQNIVLKNSTITVPVAYGFGIRLNNSDDNVDLSLTVENCTITADAPILLRGAKSKNYDINLTGNNTLTTNKAYHIIATASDYKAGTELTPATGNVNITGEEGFNVYPMENTTTMSASSDVQLSNVIAAGATTINLTEGNYTLPAVSNKNITIAGTEDVVITINKPAYHGSDVTLKGVTVKGSGEHTGIQHVNNVTYDDVTIVGSMCLYGEKVVFNNCVFELNNQYIWTYGAKKTEFNKCTFNTTGKAILIYKDGGLINTDITVKECTFNASTGATATAITNQNCAAIEIHNYQSNITLTTEKNTVDSDFSGEWRIKNYDTTNNCTISVNGTIYTQIAVDGKLMTIDDKKNVTVIE